MPAKTKTHPVRIVPSMLDQMEAMVRHPEFRRSVELWRSIFTKNYVELTEAEEREQDAPRTTFRVAAILEGDAQWLSRSIQTIRQHGEARWAFEAMNGPSADQTHAVNIQIPADLSLEAIQQCVAQFVRQSRKTSGVTPMQHPRRPEIDAWLVHDMKQEHGLSLLQITRRLFGETASGPLSVDPDTTRCYRQVERAYRHAQRCMNALERPAR